MTPVLSDNSTLSTSGTLIDFNAQLRPGASVADGSELHTTGAVVLGVPLPSDAASVGSPSPVTAAIGIAPGSTVRIAKYCIEPDGRITLVLTATNTSAVRVHVESPSGTPSNWTIKIVTPTATVQDVHTDYVVATSGNRTFVTLLDGALNLTPTGGSTITVSGRQTLGIDGTGGPITRGVIADGTLPIVDDPAPPVASALLRPAVAPVSKPPTTQPTTTIADSSRVSTVSTTTPTATTIARAPTPVVSATFFPPQIGAVVKIRVCFSAALRRTQPALVQVQQQSFAVEITPIGQARTTKNWQLRVADYPTTLTATGQWNGKTFRVTRWFTGPRLTASLPHGTAKLTLNTATRTLVGPWTAAKNGSGTWKLSYNEPPTC